MNKKLVPVLAAAFALPTFAFAQGSGQSGGQTIAANNSAATEQQGEQNLPQKIRQTLKDDGYTNVNVVPGSYVVTAKDKRGNPTTMIIGPHSMTMLTAVSSPDASATSGSGRSSGNTQK